MFDLGAYVFRDLNTRKSKPEEQFTDTYVEEVYQSEHVRTAPKQLRLILDIKYKKADLYMVMKTQRKHLMMTQHNDLLKLLQKFEELFNGTLGTQKTDTVDFELKEDAKPICSQLYPVPKLHEEMFKKEVGRVFLL